VALRPFAGRTCVSHRLWCAPGAFAPRGRGGTPASHRAGGRLARERVDRRQFLLSLSRASPRRALYRRRGGARQRRALSHAIHAGLAPLDDDAGPGWLAAPRGRLLAHLLARARGGERLGARLAITTPSHLSRLVRAATIAVILREATLGLANLDPSLSAKAGPSQAQCAFAMTAIAVSTFAFGLAPAFALAGVSLSMTCFFLASIWLRLFAGAASTACGQEPFRARVEDRRLPVYSVVAALHREARVVPQLAAALDAIDYPGIMAQLPQDQRRLKGHL
jgi:hypothetical protein